ncbi:unnamed protein product [Onchocerca flexuosa]|uniref:Uncharacterized protein n=1 Tax=Onchocerca flexuosa TaxID=387005 RepID=A0A183HWM7_9BILA|nr:unnamed protein product [Onchocerca flexuosa]
MTEGIPKRKNLLNGSKKITATDGYFKAPDDAFDNEKPYKKGQKMRMTVEDAEMENNFCWETMVGQVILVNLFWHLNTTYKGGNYLLFRRSQNWSQWIL